MKLIHTGDLHIGKMLSEFGLLEDQIYILHQIVEIAKAEKADAILLAGDIYDRAIPPADAVKALNDFLTALCREGICIFMVSGNHDSPERLSFARELLREQQLYIAGEFGRKVEKVSLSDKWGDVNFYLLPFAKPAVMRYFGYEGTSYGDCVAAAVAGIELETNTRNVLLTHHFVAGDTLAIEEPEAEYPISVGGIDVVDYRCLAAFDYVALGHIHRAQRVGCEHIRYAGSPLMYSFSEVGQEKSVQCIELQEKGTVLIKEIELCPQRRLRAIRGELDELLREEIVNACNPEDYLMVTLTDMVEKIDPLGKLRSAYPNICKLVLEKNIRHESELKTMAKEMTRRSMLEIYEEFYQKVTDRPLDEVSRKAITEIIVQTGES